MRVINYLTEENYKLYDVSTMMKLLGTSKSSIQREIKKQKVSPYVKYKNQYLYPENTLFTIMESMLYKKWRKEYGH